ncbi:putative allantoate deiminase [Gracilariopsis chorda]|uniref:Putative allantoate deiminase n=1 Tax=Gracilariopsis chorda TaxID=448386 RepID=A0A2V3IQW6_9FLOR|nr:putative allantoate deiminase [Gracilariopsis chorda]|eukprot:PXF44489.1 putative allantoate deiminase [Gracilariopsis chorda]
MTAASPHPRCAPLLSALPLLFALLSFLIASRSTSVPAPTLHQQLEDLSTQVVHNLHHLATISESPHHLNRPFLSNSSKQAHALLHRLFTQAALSATADAAGNVIATLTCATTPSSTTRPLILLGSHHDTVVDAGRFDGTLGIFTALAVAQSFRSSICTLPFDISIIAFDDEEGNNPFSVTNFGARAFVAHDLSHITALPTFQQAHHALHGPSDVPSAVRHAAISKHLKNRLLAYVELHIEQGPVLEAAHRPVGVVDAIAGQTRIMIRVDGQAKHAGTTPMNQRRDALTAAAQLVLHVEDVARHFHAERLVATVGKLDVYPAATNVVPGSVSFSVDVRAPSDRVRNRAVQLIRHASQRVALARSVQVDLQIVHQVDAVRMSDWLVDGFKHVLGDDAVVLTSGAGHDAQFMKEITDVGMLFVRCKDGISHSPLEAVSDQDVFQGVLALRKVIERIAEKAVA